MPALEHRGARGADRPDHRDRGDERVLGRGREDLVRDAEHDPERDGEVGGDGGRRPPRG